MLLLFSLVLVACSDGASGGGEQPSPEEYDDVAKSVGSMVVGAGPGGVLASMEHAGLIATGTYPFGFVMNASGEVEGAYLGVDYSYELTCEDASGAELDPCDDTTDSADVTETWSGTITVPPQLSVMVDWTGEWSITGPQWDLATFDGYANFELDASVHTGAVTRSQPS